MDKNTFEYMEKRVIEFSKLKNETESVQKNKNTLDSMKLEKVSTVFFEIKTYSKSGNYMDNKSISMPVALFERVRNALFNEYDYYLHTLNKEMEEI